MMSHHLYRHYNADAVLLYVGASADAFRRLEAHRQSSWFDEITRVEIEHLPDHRRLIKAERAAILSENPIYNKQRFVFERLPTKPVKREYRYGPAQRETLRVRVSSQADLDALEVQPFVYDVAVGHGLSVRVGKTVKSFRWPRGGNHKPRVITYGNEHTMTLDEAKAEHADFRKSLLSDDFPGTEQLDAARDLSKMKAGQKRGV